MESLWGQGRPRCPPTELSFHIFNLMGQSWEQPQVQGCRITGWSGSHSYMMACRPGLAGDEPGAWGREMRVTAFVSVSQTHSSTDPGEVLTGMGVPPGTAQA